MSDPTARTSRVAASRSAEPAHRAARRFGFCLLSCAAGTVLLAVLIGLAPGAVGITIGVVLWLLLLIGLTVYQRRQQALIKEFNTLHVIVVMTWASLWIITVMGGSYFFPGDLTWWLPAGIVTALPPLIGGLVVLRATR